MLTSRQVLSALLASVLVVSLVFTGARAQTATSTNLDKLGLTVSPVVDEFTAKPASTVSRQVKITNPVRQTITLYPVVLNFYTNNDQGQPTFYTLQERSSQYSLSDWVSFPQKSVTIAPGQSEQFPYTIAVPADGEPGGHYGAVLFSTEPPTVTQNQSQVSVVGLIGTLVLVSVPGDVVQKTVISTFDAPSFLVQPPVRLALTFNNLGNIHTKPTGEIRIKNMFGSLVTSLKVNEGLSNVLPQSQRKFNLAWKFGWQRIGYYTATAIIAYGNPEQALTATRSFIIIPIWFFVLIGLLIALIIFWIVRRRRAPNLVMPPTQPAQPRSRIVMR